MYEIDRKKFGARVSGLRKEKGFTQKELAQKLFVSDKAVSKWETGISLPDTSLLLPLADLLGISVTELLSGEEEMNEAPPVRTYQQKNPWSASFLLSLAAGILILFVCFLSDRIAETLPAIFGLSAVFGVYFCFFVPVNLPNIYDRTRITIFRTVLSV